jgi:L-alanine-DL-glutamate epimerase-like enolase superfamily enzyme
MPHAEVGALRPGTPERTDMKRREWLKKMSSTAALSVGGGVSAMSNDESGRKATRPATLETEIVRLQLRHTWTTVMSSSNYRDNLLVRLNCGDVTGRGEGAPIVRYHENAESARRALESVSQLVGATDPWHFEKLMAEVFRRISGEYAAKAALDISLMDAAGQRLGVPLYRYFGLDRNDAPVTTFSIGIDTPETTRQKVLEAEQFPVLKIKVGLQNDEETIESVRSVTKKPIRVDANEGWKDKEEAVRKINWLESRGVEFVEQPMPASMLEETRWVRGRVHIPIIADEACLHPADIPRLANSYDGVNIKLMKCGGMLEAFRMIQIAKSLGMKTMLGCMIESSIGVTAAAHLSPLVDYADLDGNLLIANDPYSGVRVEKGKLILPERPGLGVAPATRTHLGA